jgi:hypothetical protein
MVPQCSLSRVHGLTVVPVLSHMSPVHTLVITAKHLCILYCNFLVFLCFCIWYFKLKIVICFSTRKRQLLCRHIGYRVEKFSSLYGKACTAVLYWRKECIVFRWTVRTRHFASILVLKCSVETSLILLRFWPTDCRRFVPCDEEHYNCESYCLRCYCTLSALCCWEVSRAVNPSISCVSLSKLSAF